MTLIIMEKASNTEQAHLLCHALCQILYPVAYLTAFWVDSIEDTNLFGSLLSLSS